MECFVKICCCQWAKKQKSLQNVERKRQKQTCTQWHQSNIRKRKVQREDRTGEKKWIK